MFILLIIVIVVAMVASGYFITRLDSLEEKINDELSGLKMSGTNSGIKVGALNERLKSLETFCAQINLSQNGEEIIKDYKALEESVNNAAEGQSEDEPGETE